MNNYLKALVASLLLFTSAFCFGETVSFQEENFNGNISYNAKGKAGDAIFARLCLNTNIKGAKKRTMGPIEQTAVLQLFANGKKIENARFYSIQGKSRKMYSDLLASIPLSLYLDTKDTYELKVIFTTGVSGEKEVMLPFTLEEKVFNKEEIKLNEKSSEIKQDMGPERLAQIEKINKMFQTVTLQSVFSLKPFIKPVSSDRMTAYCGDRRVFKYTNGKSSTAVHYGNDYGVPENTEVYACGEGRVVMAENRISTGWSVGIEHLPGLYSVYYHMNSLTVKEGEYVKQGDKIGLSGSTGISTGPHLHWEIRLNGSPVIPDFFMNEYLPQLSE